jgi:ribonuclease R
VNTVPSQTSKFERRLIEHLRSEGYTPARLGDVAKDLNIPAEQLEAFGAAVKELHELKRIDIGTSGHLMLPSIRVLAENGNAEVEGVFRRTQRGFGFVQPTSHVREGAIYIAKEETGDALSGDTVLVRVLHPGREGGGPGDGPSGRIVEVTQRRRSSYTGVLTRRGNKGSGPQGASAGQWLVLPDGKQLKDPIVVKDAESSKAREGDKVVIELLVFPEDGMLGEGVIVRVLGDAGKPDVETQAVIAAYDLPGEFPEKCVEQAREANADFERQIAAWKDKGASTLKGRLDVTGDYIITIDPPDAKDYDDAISIRRLPKEQGGGWELGVHIADVAHFIPLGSELDVEAKDRANSCYLPRLVIPMLPEVLSNGICSLQEGVPRFCKSAYIRYDERGNVLGEWCCQTLIKSAKRLTYLEAQFLIDGDLTQARHHAKTPPKYTDQLLATLAEMNACARAIQVRRDKRGMIVLDLPEVELVYDEHGHVVDAQQEDGAFTHKLIEMFMVEANEVLARLFERMGVPLLRRIHPEPVPGDVDGLRKVAMVAGYRIPRNPTRDELQGLLKATAGTPAARAVHFAVLRTLSQAEYSPNLVGHFALASEAYAHFTSPIRRYADLTVHRALAEYLHATDNGQKRPQDEGEWKRLGARLSDKPACVPEGELVEIGRHATQREKNAEMAERELRAFLVLQLLEKHVGETFRAIVTGITPRGVFIQIEKYLADGFVKSDDLPGDVTRENLVPIWKIDAKTGALVDIRSGRSFNFGDTVSVKIASVDLARRQMECVVVDADKRAAGKAKQAFDKKPLAGGGMGKGGGAGFGDFDSGGKWNGKTGSQKRSQRSKSRDQRKTDHRRDSGGGGKR